MRRELCGRPHVLIGESEEFLKSNSALANEYYVAYFITFIKDNRTFLVAFHFELLTETFKFSGSPIIEWINLLKGFADKDPLLRQVPINCDLIIEAVDAKYLSVGRIGNVVIKKRMCLLDFFASEYGANF